MIMEQENQENKEEILQEKPQEEIKKETPKQEKLGVLIVIVVLIILNERESLAMQILWKAIFTR